MKFNVWTSGERKYPQTNLSTVIVLCNVSKFSLTNELIMCMNHLLALPLIQLSAI